MTQSDNDMTAMYGLFGKAFQMAGLAFYALSRVAALFARLLDGLGERLSKHGARSALLFLKSFVVVTTLSFLTRLGVRRVQCPCCGWEGYDFFPLDGTFFYVPREYCPNCKCYNRHRAFRLYMEKTDRHLFQMKGILLNYAPEKYLYSAIRQNPAIQYVAADLAYDHVTDFQGRSVQSNILQIPLRDNSVDAVACFHLLEHLEDDLAGVRELHRVLKPGGVAYIIVPIDLRLETSVFFGYAHPEYWGHFWSFGPDYPHRLTPYFDWQEIRPEAHLTPGEMFRHGVAPQEIIYRCTKRA